MKAEIEQTGEVIDVELSEDGKSITVSAEDYRKMMSYAPRLPLHPFANKEKAKFEFEIVANGSLND